MNASTPNADAISDWSKWVMGLSLFSTSGCVSVLLTKGVKQANLLNIKLAILFFLLTILIAWIVQFFVAVIKSGLTYKSENGVMLFSYKTVQRWLKPLIITEIIAFTFSLLFLALWIMKLPPKESSPPAQTSSIYLPGKNKNAAITEINYFNHFC